MSIFLSILVIGLSVLLIWKSAWMGQNFPLAFAEEKFHLAGMAGTTTFYRLVGLVLIAAVFLRFLGIFDRLIAFFFVQG